MPSSRSPTQALTISTRGKAFLAVLPVILTGQLIAAVVGGVAILPLGWRLWKQGILRGAER